LTLGVKGLILWVTESLPPHRPPPLHRSVTAIKKTPLNFRLFPNVNNNCSEKCFDKNTRGSSPIRSDSQPAGVQVLPQRMKEVIWPSDDSKEGLQI